MVQGRDALVPDAPQEPFVDGVGDLALSFDALMHGYGLGNAANVRFSKDTVQRCLLCDERNGVFQARLADAQHRQGEQCGDQAIDLFVRVRLVFVKHFLEP